MQRVHAWFRLASERIVNCWWVVLGSAASASRYADTRNLFAWAWRELEK